MFILSSHWYTEQRPAHELIYCELNDATSLKVFMIVCTAATSFKS